MEFVFLAAALIVGAVVTAFVYFIAVNNLLAKKQQVAVLDAKFIDWQDRVDRVERIIEALLLELNLSLGFVPVYQLVQRDQGVNDDHEITTEEKIALRETQRLNLKKVLKFSKKNSVLLRNDDFFVQEKNVKMLLEEYNQLLEQKNKGVQKYNEALKKSFVKELSGFKPLS